MLDPLIAADILADIGYLLAPVAGSIGGVLAKEGSSIKGMLDGVDLPDDEGNDDEGNDDEDDDGHSLSPNSSIDVAVEKAVMGFFDRFTKKKQRELIGFMAKQTFVVQEDGKSPRMTAVFNDHFRGRLGAMYRWFAFAMGVQFSDFFTGQGGGISRALDKVKAMGGMG